MRYLALLSILATTGLAACDTGASSPKARPENKYTITGVAIVDVEKGTILPSQTVIIVGDRIDQIGAQEEMDIPENAVLVDGRGLYLMPGFADAHVHYFDAPVFGRLMIANGILLVRDMGMPNDYILP